MTMFPGGPAFLGGIQKLIDIVGGGGGGGETAPQVSDQPPKIVTDYFDAVDLTRIINGVLSGTAQALGSGLGGIAGAGQTLQTAMEQLDAGAGGGGGQGGFGAGGDAVAELGQTISTLESIANLGGRAAREFLYQDPASFINLLVQEAGSGDTHPLIRNFLMGQGDRLYAIAALQELSNVDVGEEGMTRTQDIFRSFVTPGADFEGSRASVESMLRGLTPERIPGFQTGSSPLSGFDPSFNLVAATVAPTLPPFAAATLFSDERKEVERALYSTAVATGEFQGTPIDWMINRGLLQKPVEAAPTIVGQTR